MNRRNFLKNSALALFGFSVLPPAKTYERIWKAQLNPAWVNAPFETTGFWTHELEWEKEVVRFYAEPGFHAYEIPKYVGGAPKLKRRFINFSYRKLDSGILVDSFRYQA